MRATEGGVGRLWIRNSFKNVLDLEYNKDKKEHNNLQPGEIVCLYDKGPASSWTGTVLVSSTNDPGILIDLPEGTRALLIQIPEAEDGVDYDQLAEIFVDGVSGYVHLANCEAI